MSKLERVYHLHDILRQRRTPISRHDLMDELGCSQATLYRLIQELRDNLGAPIEQDPDNRGFYYDRSLAGHFELPGLWISPDELQALLTARQILSDVQPGLLEDELDALQQRMTHLLDAKGLGIAEHPERIHIRHDAGRPVPGRMFEDVLGALFRRQRLWLRYHGRRRDAVSERTVSPQRLTGYRDRWYLDAWCRLREGLRTFSLDRIQACAEAGDTAQDLDDDALEAHLAAAYGIFAGPATETAVLRFTPAGARWASAVEWHPEQAEEWLASGAYELRVPYSRPHELLRDLMAYGPEVEVAAPPSLRRALVERLQAGLAVYGKGRVGAP